MCDLSHVSIVFVIFCEYKIDKLCSERNVPLIIDASQSAGCIPISASKFKSDTVICMPGHKGLMGPQGTGIMICSDKLQMKPLLYGGTGSDSALPYMPGFLPDMIEAGTQNTPGIAGLCKSIEYIFKYNLRRQNLEHED
jgi:selenocysteine lyase/cysteine desulfurase